MEDKIHWPVCFPLADPDMLEEVIRNPPPWTEDKIVPLKSRSSSIVQNTLGDCHSDVNHLNARERCDARLAPKTMVCHDYKGGYIEDKFVYDEDAEAPGNSYTFYNWAQIDLFVYFSHNLITIPPVCWINAAHKHGVKVLGTFITEFKDGESMCKRIFSNMDTMQQLARSLADLTAVFQFDGWLINIENPVENIEILKSFVSFLTVTVHTVNPENVVIWYDSLTEDGKLAWQNELNSLNWYFFNACDGIYLNYVWTEPKLINSVELAKHRNFDVFVGIDVFGRNTFGGGHFNCYKAAEIIRKYNLSMAIFAPGWTHETLSVAEEKFLETFLNIDTAFWKSLSPYLNTHPITQCFSTAFHMGLDKNIYNIFKQESQLSRLCFPVDLNSVPNYSEVLPLRNSCDCIQSCIVDGKHCHLITSKNLRKNVKYVHNLFMCDLTINDNTLIYFYTKGVENESSALSLTLLTCKKNGCIRKIKLLHSVKGNLENDATILEINPSTDVDLAYEVSKKISSSFGIKWKLSVYAFSSDPCNILEIGATVEEGTSIYLGAFGIESSSKLTWPYLFNNSL